MNTNNLSNQKLIEDSVKFVRLQGWVASKVYAEGKIIYSRLNKDSVPIIGVTVLEKIEFVVYEKHLEFSVMNDKLIPMIPLRALCDSLG